MHANPHYDYLAGYWQTGYDGRSLEAYTGDAPVKAWRAGKLARRLDDPVDKAMLVGAILAWGDARACAATDTKEQWAEVTRCLDALFPTSPAKR